MTTSVNVPGIGTLNFPDGMSQADMAAAIKKNFPQIHNPANTKIAGSTPTVGPQAGQFVPIQDAGKPSADTGGSAILGTLEGAFNTGAHALTSIPAGVAGAGGFIKGLLTPGGDAGDTAENWMQTAQQSMNNPLFTIGTPEAQQGLETRAANQAVQHAVGTFSQLPQTILDKGFAKTGELGNKLPWAPEVNAFINQHPSIIKAQAAVQGLGDFGVNAAPTLYGLYKGLKNQPASAPETDKTPFQTANELGYKIPPTDASYAGKGGEAGIIARSVEGVTGSAKLKVDASLKNQGITNDLAAQEIGLPEGTQLTPDALDAARAPAEAVYKKMSALGEIPVDQQYAADLASIVPSKRGFSGLSGKGINADIAELQRDYSTPKFDAGEALDEIKDLRDNARSNWIAASNPTGKNGASLRKLAIAQNKVADAILNQIDRFASTRPEGFDVTDLGQQFRDARTQLAKINTIEDAIPPGTTDVSAKALAAAMNGRRNVPLSGNLKAIAETYNNFPFALQAAGPLRNKTPINAMEGLVGTGLATTALVSKNPAAWKEALVSLGVRPISRKVLLSDLYQNSMVPSGPLNPLLQPMPPALAIQALLNGNKNPLLGQQP